MDKNLKISVIVPVYNSEKYLDNCLKSLIFQTYNNLEIICVNDGSTDESLSILQKYQNTDSRIKVVSQPNKGVSSARNTAFEIASGDYVSFIDSDDWVLLNLYQTFVDTIQKLGQYADIFIFNVASYFEGQNDIVPRIFFSVSDWNNHSSELSIHTFDDCKNPFGRNLSAANKIFRRSFLAENDIKFLENIKYEDQLFYAQAMFNAKSILLNDNIFYKYRNYFNGSATGEITPKVFDIFKIIDYVEFEVYKHNKYEEYKYALFQYKYSMLFQHYYLCPQELKEKYFEKMKKYIIQNLNKNVDMNTCRILKNIQIVDIVINNDYQKFDIIYNNLFKN